MVCTRPAGARSAERTELVSLSAKYSFRPSVVMPLGWARVAESMGPSLRDSLPLPAWGPAMPSARVMDQSWWMPAMAMYSTPSCRVTSQGELSAVSRPGALAPGTPPC